MSQLFAPCTVVNGSQVVRFLGQDVTASIKANHIFMLQDELVPYWIASNSTWNGNDTIVVLSGNYQGTTRGSVTGVVVVDATYPHAIPTISQGDVGTAVIFTAAMNRIEQIFNGLSGLTGSGGTAVLSTDSLPEGTTNLYFAESRVRGTSLTGLQTGTTSIPTTTDTVLSAIGKLIAIALQHASQIGALQAGGGGGGGGTSTYVLTVGPTAPTTPKHSDEWIDTNTGIRYTYVNDGDSSQWVNYN